MFAFIKLENKLVKVYDVGDDWQVLVFDNNGKKINERWYSQWHEDRMASFYRAVECTIGYVVEKSDINFVQEEQ